MKHIFPALLLVMLSLVSHAQRYPVGVRTVTYTDASRSSRSIAVEVHYPAVSAGSNTALAADSFPFVVWGHGFQMTASAYYPFADTLAQRGYIVAFPATESGFSPSHADFAKDLIFVYNMLISENASAASPFYQKVVAKGAIAGHSMGGGCTVLSAQYGNPAVCYFTLAEATTNPSSITAATSMTKPYLSLAGSYDCIAPYTTNQKPTYDSSHSPCKVLIDISGASHCQFGAGNVQCNFGEGVSGCANPPLARGAQVNTVLAYVEPYLDYYLKGRCRAWTSFDSVYNADVINTKTRNCTNLVPASAAISGASSFCSGSSTILAASPGGFLYKWSSGQTTDSITISAAGPYTVTVGNGVCSITSAPVTETLRTVPAAASAISGLDSICAGSDSLIYTVPLVAGVTSYHWTLPQGWTVNSGSGTRILNVSAGTAPGAITISEENSCGTGPGLSKTITLDSVPHLSGTISGADTICPGGTAQVFTFTGSTDGTLHWSVPAPYSISSGQATTTLHVSGIHTAGMITLTSSGTCGQSAPLSFHIAVADTPRLTGSISGTDTICTGTPDQVYTFTGSNTGSLLWSVSAPYQITSGQNSNAIHVSGFSTAGTITLVSSGRCGQSAALSFHPFLADTPHLSGTILGADTVCTGNTNQVYTFTGTNTGSLQWSVSAPYQISSGQSSAVVHVSGVNSTGTVTLIASGRCGQSAALSLPVSVLDTPQLSGTISGADTICMGAPDQVYTFTGTSVGSLQWSVSAPYQISSGQNSTVVHVSGVNSTGTVTLTSSGRCGQSAPISFHPAVVDTPQPAVTQSGDTLRSTVAGGGYQWYLNGSAIMGANNSQYTAASDGSYSVVVTDSHGCAGQSGPLRYISTGISEPGYQAIQIYPNPATDIIYIRSAEPVREATLINAVGQKITAGNTDKLDIRDVPAGIYIVEVATKTGQVLFFRVSKK